MIWDQYSCHFKHSAQEQLWPWKLPELDSCLLLKKGNIVNTLLRFKPQPDSLYSILYDLPTTEQTQQFICYSCDVTFELQLDSNLTVAAYYINSGDVMQTAVVSTAVVCLGHTTPTQSYSKLDLFILNTIILHYGQASSCLRHGKSRWAELCLVSIELCVLWNVSPIQ